MTRRLDSLTDRITRWRDALRTAGVIGPLARIRLIRLLIRTSPDRIETARLSAAASASFVPPTPADVIGQYLCGNTLFGTPDGFRWKLYDPRTVITADTARLPRGIRRDVRKAAYEVRFDEDFDEILRGCANRENSWITPQVIDLYQALHAAGLTASVGCYRDGELVGGVLSLLVGRTLVDMSMFHTAKSAGVTALAAQVELLGPTGRWDVIDTGVTGPLQERLGASEMSLRELQRHLVRSIGNAGAGEPPS